MEGPAGLERKRGAEALIHWLPACPVTVWQWLPFPVGQLLSLLPSLTPSGWAGNIFPGCFLCRLTLLLFGCRSHIWLFCDTWIGIFHARILEWVAISFLQGVFPTQGLNLRLLHCQEDYLLLSHWGSLILPLPVHKSSNTVLKRKMKI